MAKVVAFLVSLMTLSVALAYAPDTALVGQKLPIVTRNDIQTMVSTYAFIYDVPDATLHRVIHCESTHNPNAVGDGGHARGLVQIHDLYHPEVSIAQAFDADFSVRFLARRISEGYGREWTCYRKLIN